MFKSLSLLLFASYAVLFTYGRSLPLLLRLRHMHSSPVKLNQLEEDGTLLQNGGKMASTIHLSDDGEYMLNLTMDDLDEMETDDASAMSGEDYYEDENPIGEANYFNPTENEDYHGEDETPKGEVYDSDVMENEREFEVVGGNDDREPDEFSQRDEAAHLSRKRDWIISGLGDVENESLEKDFDEMMSENDPQFQ